MVNNKFLNYAIIIAALILGLIFAFGMAMRGIGGYGPPAPSSIASAALDSVREQQRLSAFAANYVTTVTSEQERFGLSASKTLIMEGAVTYEINLEELKAENIRWAPRGNKLYVQLPPVTLTGPQIDLTKIREYDDGGILRLITNADKVLDSTNREKGQAELMRQAQAELPMKLARDAHKRAIQQLFEVPLRAVDLTARVEAFFPDEENEDLALSWKESRPIQKPSGAAH